MPWQKVIGHINGSRVQVRSRSGEEYPVRTEYDWLNEQIYSQLHNIADSDSNREIWGWVNFDSDDPVLEDTSSGAPDGGPPKNPPWEHP